jgi:isopropanol dehydrogenase (NADP+)
MAGGWSNQRDPYKLTGDPVQQIMDLTGGEGVDSAIEALGMPQTLGACVRVTKPGGTVSNIGYHGEVPDPLRIPLEEFGLGMADKPIRTGLCPGGSHRMRRILRLMEAGKVDPIPMPTHRLPFVEVERGFRLMQTKEDGCIKPLITF